MKTTKQNEALRAGTALGKRGWKIELKGCIWTATRGSETLAAAADLDAPDRGLCDAVIGWAIERGMY